MAEKDAAVRSHAAGASLNGSGGNGIESQPGRSRREREVRRESRLTEARIARIAEEMGEDASAIASPVVAEAVVADSLVADPVVAESAVADPVPVMATGNGRRARPQPGRSRRERTARRTVRADGATHANGADVGAAVAIPIETPVVAATPSESSSAADPAVADLSTDHLTVRGGAVGRVETRDLSVTLGAVGSARGEHLSVDRSVVGAAMADRVEVSRSYARSILSRNVQLDRAAARIVIAADVRAERSAIVFLVARRVAGDVRVLFDWRGALAFGAAAGLIGGLIARARRRSG
jgi:hypothetical protein